MDNAFSEEELIELQKEIDSITWYHDIEFPYGLKIKKENFYYYQLAKKENLPPFCNYYAVIENMKTKMVDKIDFKDKAVIDIGCADGIWSFYAEQKGASEILAIDDLSVTWLSGKGINIAKKILKSKIEINQHLNLYDIASLNRTFDVIIFFGVFYHLHAIYYGLSQLRHCCNEKTKVLIEGGINCIDEDTTIEYGFRNSNEEPHKPYACVPTLNTFYNLLEMSYLKVEEIMNHEPGLHKRPYIIASPFVGKNSKHWGRPSFGLHKYDDRWKD